MNAALRPATLAVVLFSALSCATPPAPPPVPDVPLSLTVEDVSAVPRGLSETVVRFVLRIENTENRPVRVESAAWTLAVDGAVGPGGNAALGRVLAPGEALPLPFETVVRPPESALDEASFVVSASAARLLADGAPLVSTAECSGRFPVIREPIFSVRKIKIKKAELINTRFEVVLRIENPNAVPLSFTALDYELYGEGRLWTDGSNRDSFRVEARSAVDKKLELVMNFINMKRDLLDQVIRLEIVDYRFAGDARIAAETIALPPFVLPYDLRGRTSVVE